MDEVPISLVCNDPFLSTPSLLLDFDIISASYDHFIDTFPGGTVYFAMKANAHPRIVQLVANKGGGLEIASAAELDLALEAGVPGDRIICSNPIKSPTFLLQMVQADVLAVVVDSSYEVEKVAQYAPGSRVYVRLAVDNTGSVLPLAGKFGVDGKQALELFGLARSLGLDPIGLSFHVGSQCLSPGNWVNAIRSCGEVWQEAAQQGFDLYFLNIGGGYPVGNYHTPNIPTHEEIGDAVMLALESYIPYRKDFILALEPGRGLVGEAGRLVATVMGKAERGDTNWLYLDVGVFNGLMETFEGFPPVVRLLDEDAHLRPKRGYTLAGPSCDSCDVMAHNVELPEVHIGDRLVFYDAGAYTNEYATTFNGFPIPAVVLLNAEQITIPA